MKKKRVHGIELTLDDGTVYSGRRIGKGRFCEVYDVGDSKVLIFANPEDPCKEICRRMHDFHPESFPSLEWLGECDGGTVWLSEKLEPLAAASKDAWREFKILKKAWDAVRMPMEIPFRNHARQAEHFNNELVAQLDGSFVAGDIDAELFDSIRDLVDCCFDYLDVQIEIAKRNCMVRDGKLVLTDPVFKRSLIPWMK